MTLLHVILSFIEITGWQTIGNNVHLLSAETIPCLGFYTCPDTISPFGILFGGDVKILDELSVDCLCLGQTGELVYLLIYGFGHKLCAVRHTIFLSIHGL